MIDDRISRDELGLLLAAAWALRGTCGRRRVGCVLVDANGYQIGSGYNGPPSGAPHCTAATPCRGFNAISGTQLDRCEACHAERNALTRCERVWTLDTCYVTCSPCAHCVKDLLNTPCRRVVFGELYAHGDLAGNRWRDAGRAWVHAPLHPDVVRRLARELA